MHLNILPSCLSVRKFVYLPVRSMCFISQASDQVLSVLGEAEFNFSLRLSVESLTYAYVKLYFTLISSEHTLFCDSLGMYVLQSPYLI
jgi:hypothetical protein